MIPNMAATAATATATATMRLSSLPCCCGVGGLRGFAVVMCRNDGYLYLLGGRGKRRGMSSSTRAGYNTTATTTAGGSGDNKNVKSWGFIGLGRMG